jgi:hypothetical protein
MHVSENLNAFAAASKRKTPANARTPPRICMPVKLSRKSRNANVAAPTGSPKMLIEIVVASHNSTANY